MKKEEKEETKKIDYSKTDLKDIEVNEDIEVPGNAFPKGERIKVRNLKAGKNALPGAKHCSVLGTLSANKEIGEYSRAVVLLGEVRGGVYPSVNKIEGLEDSKEEIKNYFIKELEKARKEEESIFTYLFYFGFEGKNLKQGEEKLKEYFQTLKKKGDFEKTKKITKRFSGIAELSEFIWFCSNQKKLEYYLELPKLRTIELRKLNYLGENKFEEIQNIEKELNLLSLKDWVKLGNLAEFLDFDKERIESIKSGFEKVKLEEILENPEEFDTWKTARHINHLKQQDRKIDRQKSEKEFNKERASKINSGVKEYILNSPEESLDKYLENLGWKGEINEDIVFAARLHKVLANKGETKNKGKYRRMQKRILKRIFKHINRFPK